MSKVLFELLKGFIRKIIDMILWLPLLLRKQVTPTVEDILFTSDTRLLKQFTFSPGDVVIPKDQYDLLTGEVTPSKSNKIPVGGLVIGSVVGYDLHKGEVIISNFNAAEVNKPITIQLPERDLKLLKSPLEEISFQRKLSQVVKDVESIDLQEEETDLLTDLEKDESNDNDDEDDGGDKSGGGLVH